MASLFGKKERKKENKRKGRKIKGIMRAINE